MCQHFAQDKNFVLSRSNITTNRNGGKNECICIYFLKNNMKKSNEGIYQVKKASST